jgi:DNA-binding MarR family transcriptional regulator
MDRSDEDAQRDAAELLPYRLSRVVGSFTREWLVRLREHGLTVARWQVLAILAQLDGSRVGVLAEMASAEQSVTSRVVEQMERDGLVARRPAKDDGRAVEVWLTRRGRGLFTRLLPAANALVARAFEGVAPEDLRTMTDGLARAVANLDGVPAAHRAAR